MYSYIHVEQESNVSLYFYCAWEGLVYHVVHWIQNFYLIRFHVYNSEHSIFISYVFISYLSITRLRHYFSSILILSIPYSSSSSISSLIFSCVSSLTLIFYFSCRMISSNACWTIAFLSFCFPNFLLNDGSYLRSSAGLNLAYL